MRAVIRAMAAEAERSPEASAGGSSPRKPPRRAESFEARPAVEGLPAHQFPAKPEEGGDSTAQVLAAASTLALTSAEEEKGIPDVAAAVLASQTGVGDEIELEQSRFEVYERRVYRGRTIAMLRRYLKYSLETGRVPSLVGADFFRAKVTRYRVTSFEDRVIFVHDMENCLSRLDEFSRQVLGRIVLQEYEYEQVARQLGCTRMTVHRKLREALDELIKILLEVRLLESFAREPEKPCQEGEDDDFLLSDCEDGK
jgi:RNA polymerase sigma factor (sigma-70 family)